MGSVLVTDPWTPPPYFESPSRYLGCSRALIIRLTFPVLGPAPDESASILKETDSSDTTTQIGDAEKAKSRAERFGLTITNIEEKKAARAARFGISNSAKIGKSK